MAKRIAIYGTWEIMGWITYRQRYWHKKKTGKKQRYWHTVKRPKKMVTSNGRYEFSGNGRDLLMSIVKVKLENWVPNGYIITTANEFLAEPEKFSNTGNWLDMEVESP